MKNKILLSTLAILPFTTIAQNLYVDAATSLTLKNYANSIEKGQEKIEKEQNKLQKAKLLLLLS